MRASDFEERKLSKGEETEKERIVKGMKKAKGSFKDRYGKDAEAVMYATATKMAKGESIGEEKKNCGCNQDPCITYGKQVKEYSFSKKEFLDNEAENLHSENAVEIAKKFGTPKEIKQMDDMLTRHNKRGHITPEDQETRDALVRKYYSMLEGYSVLPQIDRNKYQPRDGLEGPIMTRSGKVVYYDNVEGKYYDPDTDMYLTYDEWKAYDPELPIKKEETLDEIFGISSNANHRAKTIKMLDGMSIKYKKDGRNGLIILGVSPKDQRRILDKIHKDIGMTNYRVVDEKADKEEDYKEKLKKLLKIQMDPNTSKDPQLKKELIRRKAKLLKTKESLQNEIEWKLQETALAEGYEGAIIHALKQEGINGFFNKGTLYIEDNADMERVEEIVNQTVQIPPEIKSEDDYYQLEDDSGLQGSVTPQQIAKQFPGVADKNNLVQALLKMKRGDTNYSRAQMIAAADAFKDLLSKDPMETQKLMMLLKRVKAKETQ